MVRGAYGLSYDRVNFFFLRSLQFQAPQIRTVTLLPTADPLRVEALGPGAGQVQSGPVASSEVDPDFHMGRVRTWNATVERRIAPADVTFLRSFIRDTVFVDDKIMEYIVRLGRATRTPADVGRANLTELLILGLSPRSYQHVLALARVTAFLHGRAYVLPSDVKEIYLDAARHRVARSVRAQAENIEADEILSDLLQAVPIP